MFFEKKKAISEPFREVTHNVCFQCHCQQKRGATMHLTNQDAA